MEIVDEFSGRRVEKANIAQYLEITFFIVDILVMHLDALQTAYDYLVLHSTSATGLTPALHCTQSQCKQL